MTEWSPWQPVSTNKRQHMIGKCRSWNPWEMFWNSLLFRQQAAINPSLPWNAVHPGLHSTTILRQRTSGAGTYCLLCQECDHVAAHCALAQLQPSLLKGSSNNLVQNPVQSPSQAGRSQIRICNSWNDGACTFLGNCTYRHVCSVCFRPSHPAKECHQRPRATGSGSGLSRPAAPPLKAAGNTA